MMKTESMLPTAEEHQHVLYALATSIEQLGRTAEAPSPYADRYPGMAGIDALLASIAQHQTQYRLMIETIPHCIWLADAQGYVSYLNTAWEQLTGQKGVAGHGLGWLDMIHPHDRDVFFDRQGQFIPPRHEQYQADCRIYHATEHWRHFIFLCSRFFQTSEHHPLWIGIATDMTERREAENRLRAFEEELARAGQLTTMGEMTTTLAHELNQPLTSAINWAQGCVRHLDAGHLEAMEDIILPMESVVKEAERAAEIIRRLRNAVGQEVTLKECCNINGLVLDSIHYFDREIAEYEIKIERDLMEEIPECLVDKIEIMQVLVNVLSNAIDAVSSCVPPQRNISISTRFVDPVIEIEISDTGIGLPKEQDASTSIFDQFYTTKATGMGMGLPICQTIIQKHGGTLTVNAEQAQGVTFTVSLPLNHGENASG